MCAFIATGSRKIAPSCHQRRCMAALQLYGDMHCMECPFEPKIWHPIRN